ncbi:hypothetical protein T484DRAFT_1963240, partial [Baffinella frigidus]
RRETREKPERGHPSKFRSEFLAQAGWGWVRSARSRMAGRCGQTRAGSGQ